MNRGTLFLVLAIAVDIVLEGSVHYAEFLLQASGVVTAALLGASLVLGVLGFLRIHRARVFLTPEGSARLRLAWDAFLACVVIDAIITVGTLLVAAGVGASFADTYVYLGFLSALATGLVLLWLAQVLAPPPIFPLAVVALLTGIAGSAIVSEAAQVFVSSELGVLGRALGLVSLVAWLVVFVEAHVRHSVLRPSSVDVRPP